MIATAPETAELYRRLLRQLTTAFGGAVDDVHADAIAYAAAELYHRQIEPQLWEEKSAHELLDLFGVPRAGIFAPFSLSERLVVFRRRASQSEYVNQAHGLLTMLGVPRSDEAGGDRPLAWRLDRLLSTEEAEDEGEAAANHSPTGDLDVERLDAERDERSGNEGDQELDVDVEPAVAPLADAVRALEQAARVEAELSKAAPAGPGGVDLVNLAATLNTVQVELAALRALVETLGVDLRERLESIRAELVTARAAVQPPDGEAAAAPPEVAEQPTTEVPPVLPEPEPEPEPGPAPEPDFDNGAVPRKRWRRRLLLVVLLALIGLVVAATIVGLVSYGWDRVRSDAIEAIVSARGATA